MGNACTRDAARHVGTAVELPPSSSNYTRARQSSSQPALDPSAGTNLPLHALLLEATRRLCVYQNKTTQENVLLPMGTDAIAALGPDWVCLSISSTTQTSMHERVARLFSSQAPPTAPGSKDLAFPSSGPQPVPFSSPAPFQQQQQQQIQPQPPLQRGLRCRVCEREVPTKALLHEHLATCLLVADARKQTRGSDEGLKTLMVELRRLLEEQMSVMLHTGKMEGREGGREGGREEGMERRKKIHTLTYLLLLFSILLALFRFEAQAARLNRLSDIVRRTLEVQVDQPASLSDFRAAHTGLKGGEEGREGGREGGKTDGRILQQLIICLSLFHLQSWLMQWRRAGASARRGRQGGRAGGSGRTRKRSVRFDPYCDGRVHLFGERGRSCMSCR